jgi:hypothetical protein
LEQRSSLLREIFQSSVAWAIFLFLLGFSTAHPMRGESGPALFGISLMIGIAYAIGGFLIICTWKIVSALIRRNRTDVSKPGKFAIWRTLATIQDAEQSLKANVYGLLSIVLISGFIRSYLIGNLTALIEVVIWFVLAHFSLNKRNFWSAIGLCLFAALTYVATVNAKFFDGSGGGNLLLAGFMVWAAVRSLYALSVIRRLSGSSVESQKSASINVDLSLDEKLAKLKQLYEDGLITLEAYHQKQKDLLDQV